MTKYYANIRKYISLYPYYRFVARAFTKQADARRRNLVQLRSFDRFNVCILKN